MGWKSATTIVATLGIVGTLLFSEMADAAEIKVMISGGFRAAFLSLIPEFERASGHKVVTINGGSAGTSNNSIPKRLQRGETADLVIMGDDALDELIKQGMVVTGSRVDLGRSVIGVAVRAGAPKPDIHSTQALMRALHEAKSIAYSVSLSGDYLANLFQRLDGGDRLKAKTKQVEGEPVGAAVARGEAEIGFQMISELMPVPGIDIVGPLPADIQLTTIFSAGLVAGAKAPDAARILVQFLGAPAAEAAIRRTGMEPLTPPERRR